MIICMETISGSQYEIDTESRQMRRLSGLKSPSSRQGEDGVWKPFWDITCATAHGEPTESLLILWHPEGAGTLTTQIKEVWGRE